MRHPSDMRSRAGQLRYRYRRLPCNRAGNSNFFPKSPDTHSRGRQPFDKSLHQFLEIHANTPIPFHSFGSSGRRFPGRQQQRIYRLRSDTTGRIPSHCHRFWHGRLRAWEDSRIAKKTGTQLTSKRIPRRQKTLSPIAWSLGPSYGPAPPRLMRAAMKELIYDASSFSPSMHALARSRFGASEPGTVAQPVAMTASRRL